MQKQIRHLVYISAFIFGVWAYFGIWPLSATYPHIRYGILAVVFLYLTLMASPLYIAFPKLPYKVIYLRARKALGLSAFSFALLHGLTSLRDVLGGLRMALKLGFSGLWPYFLGVVALGIMTLMAATATPQAVNKLGRYWKMLHRFVYLAGTLVILHVAFIQSSLQLSFLVNFFCFLALSFLLTLQLYRLNKYLREKYILFKTVIFWPVASVTVVLVLFVSMIWN